MAEIPLQDVLKDLSPKARQRVALILVAIALAAPCLAFWKEIKGLFHDADNPTYMPPVVNTVPEPATDTYPEPEPYTAPVIFPPIVADDHVPIPFRDNWFSDPPRIVMNARLADSQPDGSTLHATLGRQKDRTGAYQEQLVPSTFLSLEQGQGDSQIRGRVDVPGALASLFPQHPHGLYRLSYGIGSSSSAALDFNYVFAADFRKPAWEFRSDAKFVPLPEGRGIVFEQPCGTTGMRMLTLRQPFNFAGGFEISGYVELMRCNDDSIALDVAVMNQRTGAIVSVVMEGGNSPILQIKSAVDEAPLNSEPLTSGIDITADGSSGTHFVIHFDRDGDTPVVKVWVSRARPSTAAPPDARLHLDSSVIDQRPDRVDLRFWKGGRVEIRDLVIAELPKRQP